MPCEAMPNQTCQLISYIAPAAPATRRWAQGDETFLRPEIGFTPKWYREKLQIDFGKRWHDDPDYRRQTVIAMRKELRRRFAGTRIGGIDRPDSSLDLLTGNGVCYETYPWYQERFAIAYRQELEHFVALVRGKAEPTATGQEGRIALATALAATESFRTGRPVKPALPSTPKTS